MRNFEKDFITKRDKTSSREFNRRMQHEKAVRPKIGGNGNASFLPIPHTPAHSGLELDKGGIPLTHSFTSPRKQDKHEEKNMKNYLQITDSYGITALITAPLWALRFFSLSYD